MSSDGVEGGKFISIKCLKLSKFRNFIDNSIIGFANFASATTFDLITQLKVKLQFGVPAMRMLIIITPPFSAHTKQTIRTRLTVTVALYLIQPAVLVALMRAVTGIQNKILSPK